MRKTILVMIGITLLASIAGISVSQEENEQPVKASGDPAPPPAMAPGQQPDEADEPTGESEPVEEATQAPGEETEPSSQPLEKETTENDELIVVPSDNGNGEGDALSLTIEEGTQDIEGAEAEMAENLISISLDDVPMADVVRLFTSISGANIIATPSNLQGKVTANLTGVEWKPAMESILAMHNLALQQKRPGTEIYSITPKPPGAPEPLVVETVFLNYATVADVVSVIQPMVGNRGSVSPFPSRNALVVRTTAANLGEVEQVVKSIDKLREQVFIEAKFMELNDDAIKDLGINWQVLQEYGASAASMQWSMDETRSWTESKADTINRYDTRSRTDTLNERYTMDGEQEESDPTREIVDSVDRGRSASRDIEDSFSKVINDVRTAVLSADDFRLVLSALKQMQGVSVVSNPKIIVANEEAALIHIGEIERPFESTVTPATDTSGPVITYNPGAPVEFGVKLNVTPTVNTESNITVKIEPELTRFVRDAVAPNGQTYPIIATKKISTVFCLESGRTVAIGGLTETEDNDNTRKIPLLGDIPLIGKYLFSHKHTETSQKETMIFVTLGYAQPGAIEKEDGLPQQTKLTQKRMIQDEITAYETRKEVEEIRKERDAKMDKQAENIKRQLLKGSGE